MVAPIAVDRSRAFSNNLALFIQHHLSRHGALAEVARRLDVEPSKLRRYANRKGSRRELRDVEFVYQLVVALNFDPITVFSAAQRAESLAMLLALAEGSLEHRLSAEFQSLTARPDDSARPRPDAGRAAIHLIPASSDVA